MDQQFANVPINAAELNRLCHLAEDLIESGNHNDADAVLNHARARHADTADLLALCGVLALRRGDGAAAKSLFLRALARDRENPILVRNLAAAYGLLGERDRAASLHGLAWEMDPLDLSAIQSYAGHAWAS